MLAKANNASPKGAFRLSAAERKKYNRMTDKEDKMNLRIALAGNPNSGKTTLFNALTGSKKKKVNLKSMTELSSPTFPVFIRFHPIHLKRSLRATTLSASVPMRY